MTKFSPAPYDQEPRPFSIRYWFPELSKRSYAMELMDDQMSDSKSLYRTLSDFVNINLFLSNYQYLLRRYIISDMKKRPRKKISIVDIGCGGGDIARWLVRECKKEDLDITVYCIDSDSRVVEYANRNCQEVREITVVNADLFNLDLIVEKPDYVISNHLIHHLSDEKTADLLLMLDKMTSYGFLINDLRRSRLAYLLYSLLSGILWRKSFAFTDGRLSISKSFKVVELQEIIEKLLLRSKPKIFNMVPFRLVLYSKR